MGPEEQLIVTSIFETRAEAWNYERKYCHITFDYYGGGETDKDLWIELLQLEDNIVYYVHKMFRDTAILAERLKLPIFAQQLHTELQGLSEEQIKRTEQDPEDHNIIFPTLAKISGYFESLTTITSTGKLTGLNVLKNILKNTPGIIKARTNLCPLFSPKNEKEVKEAVHEVLQFAFPDVTRETGIQQAFKVYKFDLGVRSLFAAIEYKFADSEAEFKKSLDELYADIQGYSGDHRWRNFFAVVYCTDHFANQEQFERAFSRIDKSWTPIVVFGKGKRLRKKKKVAVARPAKIKITMKRNPP